MHEDTARQLNELRARVAALEAENRSLQRDRGPLTRRRALTGAIAGAGALVAAGAVRTAPADAQTGGMFYGAVNDAGGDTTELKSSNQFTTLILSNSDNGDVIEARTTGGGSALFAVTQTASNSAIRAVATASGSGNLPAIDVGAENVGSSALNAYIQPYPAGSVNGMPVISVQHYDATGFGIDATVRDGALGSHAAIKATTYGPLAAAMLAEQRNTTSTQPALNAFTLGTGAGIWGSTEGASGEAGVKGTAENAGAGVLGQSDSYGTDPGVSGEAVNASGSGDGVRGTADGTGAGVRGISSKGRGGIFKGKKAQLQLVPSSAQTHPPKGRPGDLFVDKSATLWFCKTASTWVQLA